MDVPRDARPLDAGPRLSLGAGELVLQLRRLGLGRHERGDEATALAPVADEFEVAARDADGEDAAHDRSDHVGVARRARVEERGGDHDGEDRGAERDRPRKAQDESREQPQREREPYELGRHRHCARPDERETRQPPGGERGVARARAEEQTADVPPREDERE